MPGEFNIWWTRKPGEGVAEWRSASPGRPRRDPQGAAHPRRRGALGGGRRVRAGRGRRHPGWIDCQEQLPGEPVEHGSCALHDPLAVAAVSHPELVTWREALVEVATFSRLTRGVTVADLLQGPAHTQLPDRHGGRQGRVPLAVPASGWRGCRDEEGEGRWSLSSGRSTATTSAGPGVPAPGETVLGGELGSGAAARGATRRSRAARLGAGGGARARGRVGPDADGGALLTNLGAWVDTRAGARRSTRRGPEARDGRRRRRRELHRGAARRQRPARRARGRACPGRSRAAGRSWSPPAEITVATVDAASGRGRAAARW